MTFISKTGALNTAWLETVARYHALRGKISDYKAMSQKIGQPAPVSILIQAESLHDKIKSLEADFSTAHTITRQSAAIDETMSIIYAAMRGQIRSNAHLWAIGYAIAPTLLAIWFPWLAKRYSTTEYHDIDKRIKQDKEFGEKLERHNGILRDNNARHFVNRFYQGL